MPVNDHEIIEISDTDKNFNWIESVQAQLASLNQRTLWLVSRNESQTGLLGLFKVLKQEHSSRLRCLIDPQGKVSVGTQLWNKILESDLIINIVKNEQIGTMIHLNLSELSKYSVLLPLNKRN